uniref:Reverse transcriptase domain-containing protein n=1 Tax=Oryza brachyantha TaxID=4533 RepID=J3LQ58_ORYBR
MVKVGSGGVARVSGDDSFRGGAVVRVACHEDDRRRRLGLGQRCYGLGRAAAWSVGPVGGVVGRGQHSGRRQQRCSGLGWRESRMRIPTKRGPHFGHFEFRVMSFGLTGAPATFQAAMNETLTPVLRKCALVFFYGILMYSPNLEAHVKDNHWKVKLSKCSLALHELNYLAHTIGAKGGVY